MEWRRISERCPSVKFMCRALLPDYRLTFPRYSRNNGCWTAHRGFVDVMFGADFEDHELLSDRACRCLCVGTFGLGPCIVRVDEHGNCGALAAS
jgi:hypothetical protein